MIRSINKIMDNPCCCYYGHGTGGDENVINSIFKYGLRCSHNDMYYTTIPLGVGGQIPKDTDKLFDKWPHCAHENVIIIALPTDYHILDNPGIGTYQEKYGAFCYIPSEPMQKEGSLTNSRYVRPEFIVGCYNTKADIFKPNQRYFEIMYPPKRKEFMDQIKSKYLDIISESCGIMEYKSIVEGLPNCYFPLTDEEINALKK